MMQEKQPKWKGHEKRNLMTVNTE